MKQFAIFVVALMATLFVGCTNNDFDPNNPPKMELDTYELNVDGGGGDIPIFYAVRNAIKGAQPEVISTANWVKIKEITSSTIVLSIAPSDINEERFASVTIKYQGMEPDLRVSILQDKQLLNKFRFECTDLTYNSCTVK
jgi:hypothetical protein